MSASTAGLRHNPDFLKLWFGQTVSEFGSRITRDGLPLIAVITLSASPEAMGLLTAAAALPALLISLPAGAWVDRRRRRPILIATDLLRAGLLATIPLCALLGWLNMTYLIIIAALTSGLALIYDHAYRALLPGLVGRDQVLEGNSKLATTDALAEVGGPSIAGALVQAIGAPFAILFDALSFLVSAFSISRIRKPEAAPTVDGVEGAPSRFSAEIGTGIRAIARDPILRTIALALAARAFFGSFFGTLYGLYVVRELGLGPGVLGLLISSGGIGALIGAAIAGGLTRRLGAGRAIITGLLVSTLANVLIPLAGVVGSPVLAIALLAAAQIIGDAAMVVYGISEISLRQSRVPDHLLGRANATIGFAAEAAAPIGALIAGALAGGLSVGAALLIAVIGTGSAALLVALSPVRNARLESANPPDGQPVV